MVADPDPEHPARAPLQRVPGPLHRGIHGRSLPLGTEEGGSMASSARSESARRDGMTAASCSGVRAWARPLSASRARASPGVPTARCRFKGALAQGRSLADHSGRTSSRRSTSGSTRRGRRAVGTEERRPGEGRPHQQHACSDTRAGRGRGAERARHLFDLATACLSTRTRSSTTPRSSRRSQRRSARSADRPQGATYNPKTKKYFAFSDNYVPDPVVWRHDLWNGVGASPSTWDNVRRAAPKLKAAGHPLGIGQSARARLEHGADRRS